MGDPFLRHPGPVPGDGRPGRPVRVGGARRPAGRGAWADRRDRPRAPRGRAGPRAPGRDGGPESVAVERLVRRHGVTLGDLAGLSRPRSTFVAAVRAFLDEHGHLGQMYDDLALPSWVEEPQLLLDEIAKRIEHSMPVDAETRRRHLADEAETLAAKAYVWRWRTTRNASPVSRSCSGTLAEIGPLTEVHNYWIDRRAQSSLRRLVMRTGGRLAAAGVIATPADILFLHRDEVPAPHPIGRGRPRPRREPAGRLRRIGRRSARRERSARPRTRPNRRPRERRPLRRRPLRVDRAGRDPWHRRLGRDRPRDRPGWC